MVPLHMAMVAATVANGGQMMKPYVVDQTLAHDGSVLSQTQPEVWKTPITPATADILEGLMISVAERGTASCCIALEGGIPVAAKTGTAQLNGPGEPERSHAWIIAFAPADNPQYAVAVMLKGTTTRSPPGPVAAWPARSPRPSSTPPWPGTPAADARTTRRSTCSVTSSGVVRRQPGGPAHREQHQAAVTTTIDQRSSTTATS